MTHPLPGVQKLVTTRRRQAVWSPSSVRSERKDMQDSTSTIEQFATQDYKFGFVTDIEQDTLPPGLNEDVVRFISAKKGEPEWLLDWRLQAPTGTGSPWRSRAGRTSTIRRSTTNRSSTTRRPSERRPEEPRRGRSRDPQDLREARHPAARARDPRRRRGRCGLRQRLRGHHLQGASWPRWGSSSARSPRRCGSIPSWCRKYLGSVVPVHGQLLRHAQLGGVLGRLVRLHPQGRALPDGAVHLLPHQRQELGPVRAHADHRRRGGLRVLPRGLHGADARREPAPRRRGRAGRARQRDDQVLDRPELVPGRRERQGRHLQLRHQARQVRGARIEDLVDASRDRLGHHLEVPERHPQGRRFDRRVLLGRPDQGPAAGRHRHEDDPHRQEHEEQRSSPRASRPATGRTRTAAR